MALLDLLASIDIEELDFFQDASAIFSDDIFYLFHVDFFFDNKCNISSDRRIFWKGFIIFNRIGTAVDFFKVKFSHINSLAQVVIIDNIRMQLP